jgi:acyl-CoA thioester hydrolase
MRVLRAAGGAGVLREMRVDGSGASDRVRASGGSARRRAPGGATASVEIEVPFHDVDSLGIVWHGHYYKYLELARTALLRACQLDARDLRKLGFGMVMIESRCRHVAPLRYADVARVSAWFRDVRHRIRIAYEIVRAADGVRVARAETMLASVTRDGELLLETPAPVLRRLQAGQGPRLEAGQAPRV